MAELDMDVCVVGAGIAGASAAYELAEHASVLVVEREPQPGYHATGRSAALYTETYGNADIRALTVASRAFLQAPPPGFADAKLLSPRGVLLVGRTDQAGMLEHALRAAQEFVPEARHVGREEAIALCPILRPDYVCGAVWESGSHDIDVNALHWGFLRGLRQRKGQVLTDCSILAIARDRQGWNITTTSGSIRARSLVNAAGAWADEVSVLAGIAPVGLAPKRRTVATVDAPPGVRIEDWPCVIDVAEKFYFKPDAGAMLISPADETPSSPCDAQPDDLDIAIAVDRIQQAADLPVQRLRSRWAGLRTFVQDRSPVLGPDPDAPSFFWLAGQGGYGIMTAPAMGVTLASLLLHGAVPQALESVGFDARRLAPDRFR